MHTWVDSIHFPYLFGPNSVDSTHWLTAWQSGIQRKRFLSNYVDREGRFSQYSGLWQQSKSSNLFLSIPIFSNQNSKVILFYLVDSAISGSNPIQEIWPEEMILVLNYLMVRSKSKSITVIPNSLLWRTKFVGLFGPFTT